MPSTVDKTPLKRKRAKAPENPSKRPKAESSDEEEDQIVGILALEDEILKSKKNYNDIAILLGIAQNEDDPRAAEYATISLCRVFMRLLASGALSRKAGQSERETVVIQWLKGKLSDFKKHLLLLLGDEYSASTSLTLTMRLLKAETQIAGDKSESNFPKIFLKEVVGALISNHFEDVQKEFCNKYLGEFADVRFYAFQALR